MLLLKLSVGCVRKPNWNDTCRYFKNVRYAFLPELFVAWRYWTSVRERVKNVLPHIKIDEFNWKPVRHVRHSWWTNPRWLCYKYCMYYVTWWCDISCMILCYNLSCCRVLYLINSDMHLCDVCMTLMFEVTLLQALTTVKRYIIGEIYLAKLPIKKKNAKISLHQINKISSHFFQYYCQIKSWPNCDTYFQNRQI